MSKPSEVVVSTQAEMDAEMAAATVRAWEGITTTINAECPCDTYLTFGEGSRVLENGDSVTINPVSYTHLTLPTKRIV